MLDDHTYPDKEVIKFAGQFVPLKIDMDKQGEIGKKYNVEGTPTLLFLTPEGKIIGSFVGYHPPKEFIEESKKVLKNVKGK